MQGYLEFKNSVHVMLCAVLWCLFKSLCSTKPKVFSRVIVFILLLVILLLSLVLKSLTTSMANQEGS